MIALAEKGDFETVKRNTMPIFLSPQRLQVGDARWGHRMLRMRSISRADASIPSEQQPGSWAPGR